MTQNVVAEKNPYIHIYEGASEEVPKMAAWPLPKEAWEHFVGADEIITFTAVVPLETLVHSCGMDGVKYYVRQAFNGRVDVANIELRVVGHTMFDDFDEECSGDVHLQITGNLVSE